MIRSGRPLADDGPHGGPNGIRAAQRKTVQAWQATATEMVVLGVVVALIASRDAAHTGSIVALVTALIGGGFLVGVVGLRRFAHVEADRTYARTRLAPLLLTGLVLLAAIGSAAYVLVD